MITYELGQRVYFNLNNIIKGWASVEGVQGFVVIIKPELPLKDYAYSHIYVTDSQVGLKEFELKTDKIEEKRHD